MELKIEYKTLKELKPYENNAREHSTEDLDAIIASIKEFGFNDPIGIYGDENIIVEGHGRYMASKRLGLKKVPTIRLDHLTDEQRRAYTLAHNKTAELSNWDFDLLECELEDIEIDMEQFGFEYIDPEEEKAKNAKDTQSRVENIENLALAQYEGVGKYDMPEIEPFVVDGDVKEWIGFNYVLSDTEPEGKGVHFFIDDYQFERLWSNPDKYIEKLQQYKVVATPDFSPYGDMPNALCIYNHYRKQWIGKYLQENGVNIIPTVRASTDKRSFEWYLDGLPKGGDVIISSMWTGDDGIKDIFMDEYNGMYEAITPHRVFLYGRDIDGLQGNISFIQSFTTKRFNKEV